MRVLIVIGLYLVLTGYALTDVFNTAEREPHGLRRWLWVTIILVVPYVGAIAWIILQRRGKGGNGARSQGAPDDDPEYLSWIAQQERRRKRRGQSPPS